MKTLKIRASEVHKHSKQTARLRLLVDNQGNTEIFSAVVTRISPLDIRLALQEELPLLNSQVYYLNPMVDIELDLPRDKTVMTRGKLCGIAQNFEADSAPLLIDLEFPEISDEEEQVLRDSNPALVVN